MKHHLILHAVLATFASAIFLLVLPFAPNALAAPKPAISLQSTSFAFPGAGERNNNQTIGDFCCTGETATVWAANGTPAGYIYFYGFTGGVNVKVKEREKPRSSATRLRILVSGVADASHPNDARLKSAIEFSAAEMKPGLSRQITAGALRFTATIVDVSFTDDTHTSYWMDSVKVQVTVE